MRFDLELGAMVDKKEWKSVKIMENHMKNGGKWRKK